MMMMIMMILLNSNDGYVEQRRRYWYWTYSINKDHKFTTFYKKLREDEEHFHFWRYFRMNKVVCTQLDLHVTWTQYEILSSRLIT